MIEKNPLISILAEPVLIFKQLFDKLYCAYLVTNCKFMYVVNNICVIIKKYKRFKFHYIIIA